MPLENLADRLKLAGVGANPRVLRYGGKGGVQREGAATELTRGGLAAFLAKRS